jgi:hypothetical protein
MRGQKAMPGMKMQQNDRGTEGHGKVAGEQIKESEWVTGEQRGESE